MKLFIFYANDFIHEFKKNVCTRMMYLKFWIFFFFQNTGATFGTGITAIKLTALGRPQLLVSVLFVIFIKSSSFWLIGVFYSLLTKFRYLQLQLSEVIMQTRHYMMDMVGGHGMYSMFNNFEMIVMLFTTWCKLETIYLICFLVV